MVDGAVDNTVTVSVIGISAPPNPIPESEMDALLLGRTKVSVESMYVSHSVKVCQLWDVHIMCVEL